MQAAEITQQYWLNKLKEYNLPEYQRYIDLEQQGLASISRELEKVERKLNQIPGIDYGANILNGFKQNNYLPRE